MASIPMYDTVMIIRILEKEMQKDLFMHCKQHDEKIRPTLEARSMRLFVKGYKTLLMMVIDVSRIWSHRDLIVTRCVKTAELSRQ